MHPTLLAGEPDHLVATLYITSARNGLTAEELHAQPHAGSVFALATTTRGVPIHAFAA